MGRIAAYLLLGIGVGFGFAYWQGFGRSLESDTALPDIADRAPLERRLSELETSLALERFERQALADELESLRLALTELPGSEAGGADTETRRPAAGLAADDGVRSLIEDRVRQRFPDGLPQSPAEIEAFRTQRQIERLVEAGLTAERAQWILQREEELQMEVLQARYEAAQSGASPGDVARLDLAGLLREELGDADYEKYLEGQGRPTTVGVREVLPNSPALSAGLQPGDEIVSYDGKRVFDINELNELTFEARPGETVALEVLRDGQPMQVYLESGPIGISGGGRSVRREAFIGGGPGGRR